jgi:hypothetical protein
MANGEILASFFFSILITYAWIAEDQGSWALPTLKA